MASSHDLSPLQREILRSLFAREQGFFLTGGAALVGFHLHHRDTLDLDLFTTDPAVFERAERLPREVAATIGASVEDRRTAPGFRRSALTRGDETVIVDFVLERVEQLHADKPVFDGIPIDPPDEILANKLCAIVGRMEERDLVDVMMLERSGLRVEDVLPAALRKDGGCTPANLAWLISEVRVPEQAVLPAGVHGKELGEYLQGLVVRLRRAALPGPSES